jgi:hypothetical protein
MISLVRALFSPGLSPRSASLVAALMAVLVMTPSTGVAGAASPAAASASASAAISTTVPRPSDVERGRFVTSIALDTGAFKVVPAPAHVRPDLTRAQAAKEIWASPTLQGFTQGPVGFGLVTISLQVKGVPHITKLPAWVGFGKSSGVANCPAELSPPPGTPGTPGAGSTPTGPSPQQAPSNGYAAVVIAAGTGSPAVTYTARSILCESLRPASLAPASEVYSVPWRPLSGVDNNSIRVQATLPACGTLQGISSGGTAQESTITVLAVVPDVHGRCSGTQQTAETVFLGPVGNPPGAPPPLVTATTTIRHGRLGPSPLAVPPPS